MKIDITDQLDKDVRENIDKAEIVSENEKLFLDIKFHDDMTEVDKAVFSGMILAGIMNSQRRNSSFKKATEGIVLRAK